MGKKLLDIGEVAKYSGLPASTLRYYDEKGLINSVGRAGLRRVFSSDVLQRLSLISLGRLAGMSLKEISGLLVANGSSTLDRAKLLDKADELEQTILQLTAMRDGLRHVAQCPEPSHFQCPKFNKMLRVANRRVRKMNQ